MQLWLSKLYMKLTWLRIRWVKIYILFWEKFKVYNNIIHEETLVKLLWVLYIIDVKNVLINLICLFVVVVSMETQHGEVTVQYATERFILSSRGHELHHIAEKMRYLVALTISKQRVKAWYSVIHSSSLISVSWYSIY